MLRALLAAGFALGLATSAPRVHAQTADELKAARELFQEAYKDEQEKRLEAALEKFQRVAKVRESASVRYRIASVLESLGRLREARDAFRALANAKPTLAANEQEVAASAEERANALDKKVPTLTVQVDGAPPADFKLTVDGKDVPPEQRSAPLPLDPGEHVVSASGTGMRPFESRVRLSEGGGVALTVPVSGAAASQGGGTTGGTGQGSGQGTGQVADPGAGGGSSGKTLGIVGLAAGGALVVTSVVLLAVREGDISDLQTACPNGRCPRSRQTELESTRDQAKLFGPLGVTLGVVGVAAAGFGAYMLLRGGSESSTPAPSASPPPAASGVRVRFSAGATPGGAAVGAIGTF